jgi:glutamate racemase
MIESEVMKALADADCSGKSQVLLVNASSLVDLIECFAFVNDPGVTQDTVTRFIVDLRSANPEIGVATMSSTHLPCLKPFFECSAPDILFVDPADSVLDTLQSHTLVGEGQTTCVATETITRSLKAFNPALHALGTPLRATLKS